MKLFVRIAILATALLCIGCLDYEQTLVINKDGSGTIKMHYAFDKEYLEMGQSMMADMEADSEEGTIDQAFKKENIESHFATGMWDIELIEYATSETDESQIWDMTFSFKNINNLWGVYTLMDEEEDTTESEKPEPVFSKQSDGSWLYNFPLSGFGDDDEEDMDEYANHDMSDQSDEDDMEMTEITPEQMQAMGMSDSMIQAMQQMQQMASKMSEHVLKFNVTFPGKIIDSNAKKVDGNTATWEFKLTEAEDAVLRAVVK